MTDIDLKARVAVLEAALEPFATRIDEIEEVKAVARFAVEGTAAVKLSLLRAAREALRSTAPAEGRVEAGWKLVPIEPTEAMLEAALFNDPEAIIEFEGRTIDARKKYESRRDLRPHIYRAMLAAAPQPPTVAREDGVEVKELDWEDHKTGHDTYLTTAKAGRFDERYEIKPPFESGKGSFKISRSRDINPFAWAGRMDAAKAAAQADFEARIRSALTPRTDVASQGEA